MTNNIDEARRAKGMPYPQSEKLMIVGRYFNETSAVSDLSMPKFVFLRDNAQSFAALTATQERLTDYLSDENQTDYIRSTMVSAEFFRVLGVQPASGRAPSGHPIVNIERIE